MQITPSVGADEQSRYKQNLAIQALNRAFASGRVREVLAAARTYYVAPAGSGGSDSNNGLTSTAPFLTIQKAVDTVAALDISGNAVTIQIADGTYTGAVTLKNVPGFATAGNLV